MSRASAFLVILGLVLAASIVPAPRSGSLPSFPVTDEGRTGAPRAWVAQRQSTVPRIVETEVAGSNPALGGQRASGAPSTGWASWYSDGPGLYAAVHSWHWHDKPYRLLVVAGNRSVLVTVRDFCACGPRHGSPTIIDLSPAAFRRLAPLSQGIVRVTVERRGTGPLPRRAVPTAPPTDVR